MAAHKGVLTAEVFAKLIFLFTGILFAPVVHAQSGLNLPEQLTADVVDTKGLTQNLAGNVKLRHKGVVLFCDQAVHNVSTHSVHAYGHVLVVQGDSITARGDSANFAYADRHLLMYGRVMFQDHRTVLTTTQFDYDLVAGVVTYSQKGRVVNEKNVLTSIKGTYNIQLKQFTCQQAVQLATGKNIVKAESIVYNTVTQRSAAIPKVIYPAVVEQRPVETKPAPKVTEATVPTTLTRQPVAEQAVVAATPAPVTKPVVTPKPVVRQPAPEPMATPTLVAKTEHPASVPAPAVAAPVQSQPSVTFSSTVYRPSSPTFRQAVQSTPTKSTAAYTADVSDLERELNKKKRFH